MNYFEATKKIKEKEREEKREAKAEYNRKIKPIESYHYYKHKFIVEFTLLFLSVYATSLLLLYIYNQKSTEIFMPVRNTFVLMKVLFEELTYESTAVVLFLFILFCVRWLITHLYCILKFIIASVAIVFACQLLNIQNFALVDSVLALLSKLNCVAEMMSIFDSFVLVILACFLCEIFDILRTFYYFAQFIKYRWVLKHQDFEILEDDEKIY